MLLIQNPAAVMEEVVLRAVKTSNSGPEASWADLPTTVREHPEQICSGAMIYVACCTKGVHTTRETQVRVCWKGLVGSGCVAN